MTKKIFSVLLCLLLCASVLPTAAMATVDVDEHTHSLTYVPASQGCEGGYGEHYVCDCGAWFLDAEGLYEIDRSSITLPEKHVKPAVQNEITTVTAATCTTQGQIRYTCAACGKTVTEPVNKLGHNLREVAGYPETCTADGQYTYYHCDRCGNNYWNTHAESPIDVSSTVISMHHSLSHVDAVEPTCTADGNIEYYVCSACGKLFSDAGGTVEITGSVVRSALGHNIVKVDAKAATCIAAGNIEHWKCTNCNTLYADAAGTVVTDADTVTLPQLAHRTVKTEAVAPACETDGNIEYWTCTACGKHFSEEAAEHELAASDLVIPKPGHALKEVSEKPACLEDGNIHYWVCERKGCGACFKDVEGTEKITLAQTVVKAAGKHDFDGGFCKKCRTPDPNYTGPSFKDSNLTVIPGEPLVIRVDADYEATQESGWTVSIDGKPISKDSVNVTPGSSVFTINSAALEALNLDPTEEHTVSVKIGDKTIAAKLTATENPHVDIEKTTNGSVTVDKSTPKPDETVTLTVTPNDGYALKELTVMDSEGATLTVTRNGNKHTFTMPALNVTVTATFKKSTKHTITVIGGTANSPEADENETVTVTADDPAEGKRFEKWTSMSTISFSDATKSPATFKMPNSNVTVTAVFKDLYSVTVSPTPANGTVTMDKSSAVEGETVKLTVKADKEYARKSLTVKNNTTGKAVTLKNDSFTMPASDVTVTATFERIRIVKGNGGTAHYGSRYSFALNTDYNDMVVWVDGRTVSGYGVDGANGTVTLGRSLIKSLAVGYHEIGFVTDRGSTIGTFYVSSSPKTGDESNVALYVTAGVISAAGIGFIAWYLLKKRK